MNLPVRWRIALLLLPPAIPALWLGPDIWRGVSETRALRSRGVITQGVVVEHRRVRGQSDCPHEADVLYRAGGEAFKVAVAGCGAAAGALPLERALDVTYLPSDPTVAFVHVRDAEVPRAGMGAAAVLAAFMVLHAFMAWREWDRFKRGIDSPAGNASSG